MSHLPENAIEVSAAPARSGRIHDDAGPLPIVGPLPITGPANVVNRSGACCGGLRRFAWVAMAVVTVGSIATAAYFAGRSQSTLSEQALAGAFPTIEASTAATSEKFSMATGVLGGDAEGVFVLDHNSGLLQCSVMYPRTRTFGAIFTINVADALATGGKGGQYIMVTGLSGFTSSSNNPAGASLVYVLDTATGNYACYGVPFNRSFMNTGRPQQGVLQLIATGTANPLLDRDSLR